MIDLKDICGILLSPGIDFMVKDIGAATLLLNDSGIMFKPLRDGIGLFNV